MSVRPSSESQRKVTPPPPAPAEVEKAEAAKAGAAAQKPAEVEQKDAASSAKTSTKSGYAPAPQLDRYVDRTGTQGIAPSSGDAELKSLQDIRDKRSASADARRAPLGEPRMPSFAMQGAAPLPVSAAPSKSGSTEGTVLVTTFPDDSISSKPINDPVNKADFNLDSNGKPVALDGPRVQVKNGDEITFDKFQVVNGRVRPVLDANGEQVVGKLQNPYPNPVPDKDGNFIVKPTSDLKDPASSTAAFETAVQTIKTAETMAGRPIPLGLDGKLVINPHQMFEANAFYNPGDKGLHMGVIPWRDQAGNLNFFSTASSQEITAHEAGHAIHDGMKLGLDHFGLHDETGAVGEFFGDQTAFLNQLRDDRRVDQILKETGGDLRNPSALSRLAEGFGKVLGPVEIGKGGNTDGVLIFNEEPAGEFLRSFLSGKKVSDIQPNPNAKSPYSLKTTGREVHDLSEPLSAAAYDAFAGIYERLQKEDGLSKRDALVKASEIQGKLVYRGLDFTPERFQTLEQYGQGMMKADKEFSGGRFSDIIADSMKKFGVFDKNSVKEFEKHEKDLPKFNLPAGTESKDALTKTLSENRSVFGLDKKSIGADADVKVEQAVKDNEGNLVVKARVAVKLEDVVGIPPAELPNLSDEDKEFLKNFALDNSVNFTFGKDGVLKDFHRPFEQQIANVSALFQQAVKNGFFKGIGQGNWSISVMDNEKGEATLIKTRIDSNGSKPVGQMVALADPNNVHRKDLSEKLDIRLPPGASFAFDEVERAINAANGVS